MKYYLFAFLLFLSAPAIAQPMTDRELIANFYRSSAEQIMQASRKFAEENKHEMFAARSTYKDFSFIPDSLKVNNIIELEDGFMLRGIVYTNDVKSLGKMAIIVEYTFQAKENRARLFMNPTFYIAEGGKSDCPTTADIEQLRGCKNTRLTHADFVEKFRNHCYLLKKKYKASVEEILKENPDRW